MDTMSNQERGQSGSGVGSTTSDDVKIRMPVGDVFNKQDQNRNNTLGQPAIPYELSTITDRLGDIFVSVLSIKKIFVQASNNPSIDDKQRKSIEKINQDLDEVNKIIANMTSEMDILKLNK
jgi:hypothetical protein